MKGHRLLIIVGRSYLDFFIEKVFFSAQKCKFLDVQ